MVQYTINNGHTETRNIVISVPLDFSKHSAFQITINYISAFQTMGEILGAINF